MEKPTTQQMFQNVRYEFEFSDEKGKYTFAQTHHAIVDIDTIISKGYAQMKKKHPSAKMTRFRGEVK
jgi:hypothetical protein